MAKGKDFYGKDVPEVIKKACKEMSAAQGDLAIEVIETGSAGIFGLCKKKAHIRVTRKVEVADKDTVEKETSAVQESPVQEAATPKKQSSKKKKPGAKKKAEKPKSASKNTEKSSSKAVSSARAKDAVVRELPSEEVLASVKDDISLLMEKMGFPSEVEVTLVDYTLECQITGEHEEALIGNDGRTLDSLQYLLRKMMSRRLPDRMMLSLDAGQYRQRRTEELKERAVELAAQVKEDGKTQAIAALNPSERRVVHMILQEDKAIRSRSVGEGLFKKILIYKPGKKNKSGSRKGKGRQGGRSSGNK
ncbi:MAG: RNA-binding protein [Desulfobulbus sp.]|nr:MAG: RNA-binding protein [Desulfobulbus sp.]